MKRIIIDYLAEELKKAEPVIDYLALELKREEEGRQSNRKVMAARAGR